MISQTAEYALRAMVYLSMKDTAATSEQIAQVTKVPAGYLSKILQQLGKAGLLVSQRGLHGGFNLSRPCEEISILDVVNAVDPIHRILSCPLGIESHGLNLCPLHKRISQASATVEDAFATTYLSELVQESRAPLCTSVPLTPKE